MKEDWNSSDFTHFACLPFTLPSQRQSIRTLQQSLSAILHSAYHNQEFSNNSHKLSHITISMLALPNQETRQKLLQSINNIAEEIQDILKDTFLTFSGVKYFTGYNHKSQKREVTILYLEIQRDEHLKRVEKATDLYIRQMLKVGLIKESQLGSMWISYDQKEEMYRNDHYHLTLFWVRNVNDDELFQAVFKKINKVNLPRFSCRAFDISTRNSYNSTGFYTPLVQVPLLFSEEPYEQKYWSQGVQNNSWNNKWK